MGKNGRGHWGEASRAGGVTKGNLTNSVARRVWSTCELDTNDHWETDPGGRSWNTCLHASCLSVSPTSTSQSGQREDGVQSVSGTWPLAGDRQFET